MRVPDPPEPLRSIGWLEWKAGEELIYPADLPSLEISDPACDVVHRCAISEPLGLAGDPGQSPMGDL